MNKVIMYERVIIFFLKIWGCTIIYFISDDLIAAKEKAELALIVSDCDNEETLKKSRHARKRKKLTSDSESDDNVE